MTFHNGTKGVTQQKSSEGAAQLPVYPSICLTHLAQSNDKR